MHHYGGFNFLRPEELPSLIKMEGEQMVAEIEHRVHRLLQGGQPQPYHGHVHVLANNLNGTVHGRNNSLSHAGGATPLGGAAGVKDLGKEHVLQHGRETDASAPSKQGSSSAPDSHTDSTAWGGGGPADAELSLPTDPLVPKPRPPSLTPPNDVHPNGDAPPLPPLPRSDCSLELGQA